MTDREFKESPLSQGEDESISYKLTVTPWGSTPTDVSITVWDVTDADDTDDWIDVTNDVMPVNNPSVAGDVITFSPLESLTDRHRYRVEILFTCDNGTFETYGFITGGE